MLFFRNLRHQKIHLLTDSGARKALCGRRPQPTRERPDPLSAEAICRTCRTLARRREAQTAPAWRHLARNRHGRDFVVGDIHGELALLEHALRELEFDPLRDRLISVGDLIDRGPDSAGVLELVDRPWFFAIRGNHESFLGCDSASDQLQWQLFNGGEWWDRVAPEQRRRHRARVDALPYALEIETARGLVGVVHADLPADCDWPGFLHDLDNGEPHARWSALWSRASLRALIDGGAPLPATGVDLLVCGHSPLAQPVAVANRIWIDTGATFRNRTSALTLLEIEPRLEYHPFRH